MKLYRGAGTLVAIVSVGVVASAAAADPLAVDLSRQGASEQWLFLGHNASIQDGELVLEGRSEPAHAFFLPYEWGDVTLEASFLVEPADEGVLACGFVVRAADAANYYYVHYDRGQAILVRWDRDQSWNEIHRASGLDKPAGRWHRGRVQCAGDTIKVHLNGKLLYEARDAALSAGRIGFYASQGRAHVKEIVVSGGAREAGSGFAVPPPAFVHVCRDAGAGGYEAFPDVCRLSDGRLMCVFYAGYGHVALPNDELPKGGRISFCTSGDEGRTWTEARLLYDGPDDDRDPSIVQLKSGQLVSNFFSLRKADGGAVPWKGLGSWTVASDDLGETWSEPRPIAGDRYYTSAPIRELPDGRLMLGLYYAEDDDASGAVVTSDDRGRTWGPVVEIDNGEYRLDAETDVIPLKDGSLLAALRGDGSTPMCWSKSKDGGETWSVARSFGFPGHCPYLHRTAEGILVLAHRQPATSLHYSLDEGQTWSENVPVDTVGGAYPSLVNLKDGSVLVVYYEEGTGSSIRARRFRATRSGIEWLPVD